MRRVVHYYTALQVNAISRIHMWFNGTGVGADDPILYRPCHLGDFVRGSWWGGGGGEERIVYATCE